MPVLDVVAVQVLHVRLLEHRGHGLDGPQLVAQLLEHVVVEHAGAAGGDVGVVLEHVPAAEDEVVELGERHVVVDQRHVVVGAGADADGAHLGERADRLGQALADGEAAGDEGGADGAHAGQQDAQLAGGRGDVDVGLEGHEVSWWGRVGAGPQASSDRARHSRSRLRRGLRRDPISPTTPPVDAPDPTPPEVGAARAAGTTDPRPLRRGLRRAGSGGDVAVGDGEGLVEEGEALLHVVDRRGAPAGRRGAG